MLVCNHLISAHLLVISANELRPQMQRGGTSEQSSNPWHLGKVEKEGRQAWCRGHERPFGVTWGTTFYTEGAWDRPVLTGRQELVTLWKLQGIGLVKMRSDRILICLSLLCRHTDVKGKRRGCVVVGAGVIRPTSDRETRKKEGKKGRFVHWLPRMNFCSTFFVCFKVIKATF